MLEIDTLANTVELIMKKRKITMSDLAVSWGVTVPAVSHTLRSLKAGTIKMIKLKELETFFGVELIQTRTYDYYAEDVNASTMTIKTESFR